jgi:hypothetical protein
MCKFNHNGSLRRRQVVVLESEESCQIHREHDQFALDPHVHHQGWRDLRIRSFYDSAATSWGVCQRPLALRERRNNGKSENRRILNTA